jgi:hypothetical protein
MQREILVRSLAEADIEIADGGDEQEELIAAADRSGADFVIAGAGRLAPDDVSRLLEVHPGIKVLAVSESGRQGLLYELRPHRVPIGDLSPAVLLATIRSASQASEGAPTDRAQGPRTTEQRR